MSPTSSRTRFRARRVSSTVTLPDRSDEDDKACQSVDVSVVAVGPAYSKPGWRNRHCHGAARFDDEANENPNVTPMVNCQSGAARLIPRRTPASRKTFD